MRPHQHCTLPGPSMVVHVWKTHFRHPFSATPQSWLGTAKMFLSQHACGAGVNLSTLPSAILNFLISSIFRTFFQSLAVLSISRSLLLSQYFWRWKMWRLVVGGVVIGPPLGRGIRVEERAVQIPRRQLAWFAFGAPFRLPRATGARGYFLLCSVSSLLIVHLGIFTWSKKSAS